MKKNIIIYNAKKDTSFTDKFGNRIVFSTGKKTACFNPVMEIPDSDVADAIEIAGIIADNYTEGFDLKIRTTLMIKLLYVRFSKSVPTEEKKYATALKLDLKNLNIDCVHDNGKKYYGMNTLIRVMTM